MKHLDDELLSLPGQYDDRQYDDGGSRGDRGGRGRGVDGLQLPRAGPGSGALTHADHPQAVVIAQAPLQPLESYTASGKALVEELPDGTRRLVVQLSDGPISGFREVWVISPDLSKLVSFGVLDGKPGVFAIPEGLDLAQYPIVDVSNEPFDGNPANSSDSIARGELAAELSRSPLGYTLFPVR